MNKQILLEINIGVSYDIIFKIYNYVQGYYGIYMVYFIFIFVFIFDYQFLKVVYVWILYV